MASVFFVWLVGALAAALGVIMTLHPPTTKRWKTWSWIAFTVLTIWGGEIAWYEKLDQDEEESRRESRELDLTRSNIALRREIAKLSTSLPKTETTGERFKRWLNHLDPSLFMKIKTQQEAGTRWFKFQGIKIEAYNLLIQIVNDERMGRLKYRDDTMAGITINELGQVKDISIYVEPSLFEDTRDLKQ